MGIDSKTRELLTLWRDLSPEAKARMFEKARYLALSAGLEKTPEFEAFFELPARTSTAIDSPGYDFQGEQRREVQVR